MKPLSLLVLLCAVAVCYCELHDDNNDGPLPIESVYEPVNPEANETEIAPIESVYEPVEPEANETELARREQQFKDFMKEIAIENKKCSESHKNYVHLPCQLHGERFFNKVIRTPLTSDNIGYFHKKCQELDQCFHMFICQDQREMLEIGRRLVEFCGLEVYAQTDFSTCSEKLTSAKSQCFEEWGSYPEVVFTRRGDEEEKEKQSVACQNFFGKDNCLEKEIKEICGQKEWEGFRDHYVDLNPQLMNCSLPYDLPVDMPQKKLIFTDDY
ncbi:unnamed protein product [Caenorhabditis brenneri]